MYVSEAMVEKYSVRVENIGYVCMYENCGRSIRELNSLHQHLWGHYNKKNDVSEAEMRKYSSKISGGYACAFEYCRQKVRDLFQIRLHLRSHLKIKPYKCYVCPYSACRKNTLRSHLLNIHAVTIHMDDIIEDFSPRCDEFLSN